MAPEEERYGLDFRIDESGYCSIDFLFPDAPTGAPPSSSSSSSSGSCWMRYDTACGRWGVSEGLMGFSVVSHLLIGDLTA